MLKKISVVTIILLLFAGLAACKGNGNAQLVNTQTISMDDIDSISISYVSEDITFYESDSDKLILKEYISKDKSKYYADISTSDNSIEISSGERPLFNTLDSYVEIYIPVSYSGSLSVATTSGDIINELPMPLSDLDIDSTSGSVDVKDLKADKTSVETKSSAINITCNKESGAISVYSKSGDISLSISAEKEYLFSAETDSGNISTSFDCEEADGISTAKIGDNPIVTIDLTTKSGDIEVK